jgi:hypothetical protein
MILLVRSLGELSIDSLIGLQNGFFFCVANKRDRNEGCDQNGDAEN